MQEPRALESSPRARWIGFLLALALFAAIAWARTEAALSDPGFDGRNAAGMLKSDPALLYYFVERILESGGGWPADFRADPRILHPDVTDVPALFPMGLEFVVAWARLVSGSELPLHVFCVIVTSILASLTALGAYGLALELTGRVRWALAAIGLYATMWANYRTVGFILVGEDLSLPLFAAHLYLLARAWRLRSPGSILLAALAWVAAIATWHAMSFFASIEAAVVFAWFLRSGENPLAVPRAWIFPAVALAATVVVPILWSTRFAGSVPMQLLLGLACAAWLAGRGVRERPRLALAALAASGFVFLASMLVARLSGGGLGGYSHVFALLTAKLAHFGHLPADPDELSAEVRLMWQGPFATADPEWLARQLGFALLAGLYLVPFTVRAWLGGSGDARARLIGMLLCAGLPIAWLIERTVILPGLLLPVAAAWTARELLGRCRRDGARIAVVAGLIAVLLVQGADTADRLRRFASSWYMPHERQREIRALIEAVPGIVPEGEAVLGDFMISAAILAHTRRPIVLQPKYEDRESRERAIAYFETFYNRPPEAMRELLAVYRCRYLLVDRFTLLELPAARALGGVRPGAPPVPNSFWAHVAEDGRSEPAPIPGFQLVYRSRPGLRRADGSASDSFRLYRIEP